MQKTCWTSCKTYCWIQCVFDQPPGKPVLVICANCLLFALCSVWKMKEGCSVTFVFLKSFTFCLSPLSFCFPGSQRLQQVCCYLLKVSMTEFTALGSTQNPCQGQKERKGGKKRPSQIITWKYFIKINAFLLNFVHPPKPRLKTWC